MTELVKIGLLGGPFQHAYSSTAGKHPSYFEWDKGNIQDITFCVDEAITKNINIKCRRKFGWLVEVRSIIPDVIREFKAHYKEISKSYERVFTYSREIYELAPNFTFLPLDGYWIEKPQVYPKTKLISFISSAKNYTSGHAFRLKWLYRLKDKVDVFGRDINPIDKKEKGLCDYMFSIAIENDQYESCWTEKILDCFATGTVPIYHGAPDINNFFNKNGIITLTDDFDTSKLSKELYESMMPAIQDNFQRVLKFDVIEDIIFDKYLKDDKVLLK
jgi:hypothetical protein